MDPAGPPPTPSAAAPTATGLLARAELGIGERVAGRFRIEAMLGIGGMGLVYRAHDEQLGIDVALKLLRPEFAVREDAFARFRQELLLARQVSSPHVVRIHDLVAHDGRWLIGMDYIDGGSLESRLDGGDPLPLEQALSIARQVALGLAAAHACGVVHRDLKPANVLLDRAGRAYVSDFGVARAAGATGVTATGVIVGTPEYLSPEQARGGPIDARSDQFALGLILFEMLAGRPPYDGGTPAEMLAQRIVRPAPPLRRLRADAPHWVERLVARLLALRPARRFPDAAAVARAIETRRVSLAAPEPRQWLALAALAAVSAGAGWTTFNYERVLVPRLVAAGLASQRVDWLPLPVTADADARAVARGLDELLAGALLEAGVEIADPARVRRALDLLGFDAATALRFPDRLGETLAFDRLLAPALALRDGRIELSAAVRLPGRTSAAAQARTAALTLDSLPSGIRALGSDLGLRFDGLQAAGWPTRLDTLRRFGEALALSGAQAEAAFAEVVAAEPAFAAAWHGRLDAARRHLGTEALHAVAGAALDALRGARGRDAERARALAHLVLGEPAAAVSTLAARVDGAAADLALRLQYAEALDEAGRTAEAGAQLDAVLALDPADPRALLARGRNALRAGDAQRAIDRDLGRALQLFTRLADDHRRADTLHALGVGYERLGRAGPSREHFEQAARLRESIGDARGAATSLRNVGYGLGLEGDFEAAWSVFARARALLEPLADPAALAELANDEGLVAEEAGDFARARARYREALALRRAQGDAVGAANAALNLGFLYLHGGEIDSARAQLADAKAAYAAAGDPVGQTRAAQKLAMIDFADGRLAQARERLEAALDASLRLNLAEEQAVSLFELAELDRHQGRLGDALRRLDAAGALFAQRDDERGSTAVALRRAAVAATHADWPGLEQALAPLSATSPGSLEQRSLRDLLLAEAALARGDAAHAARLVDAAAATARDSGSMSAQVQAALLRVRALAAGGSLDEARAALVAADGLLAAHGTLAARLERALAAIACATPSGLARAYADALALAGDWSGAARLHAAAGARLRDGGAVTAAAQAESAAAAAFAALRATLPPPRTEAPP
jgi:tetratricopeptide (TPR) repeat protein